MSQTAPLLAVKDLHVRYEQVEALHGVSLEVYPGEIVALIGSNGAGKSTTLRAISGMVPATSGSVVFDGQELVGMRSDQIVRRGLAHIPEARQIFGDQSVYDNLLLGGFSLDSRTSRTLADQEIRRFPVLFERRSQKAGTLSGGEQQMLAIGRALMTNPRLLILDEATEGLAPLIRAEIWRCLARLKAEGQSILVIDKNVAALTSIADRHYLIERGRVVWSGTSQKLAAAPDVQHRYLGI